MADDWTLRESLDFFRFNIQGLIFKPITGSLHKKCVNLLFDQCTTQEINIHAVAWENCWLIVRNPVTGGCKTVKQSR